MKTLYTAEAAVEGGRQGHGQTSDGRLDVGLSVPVEMSGPGGPGTNPEQLFAVGYAACFQSTLTGVARGRKLDVSDSRITSRVGIGPTGRGGFTLTVSLDLHAPQLSPLAAAELMVRAHERCPYSNATRGNIEVKLSVDGVLLETQQTIPANGMAAPRVSLRRLQRNLRHRRRHRLSEVERHARPTSEGKLPCLKQSL